ncbi:hypothetical protein F511_11423 [Dorcoceras hygrometricum]|uniref:Uncharacterized protein n=1 Tax=Dorcoceras hygrometricum TaxID=472368 RepID=A0A2Z7CZM9_9LAMI|nr:hypothetical protein F511_11423 [Dorcoceras hygrometricum]
MLKILFSKPESGRDGSAQSMPADTVGSCPDHLVLADLPVAKGLGSASATPVTKIVGHSSRRQLGERVHFCLKCDFPIAIYGRCLDSFARD